MKYESIVLQQQRKNDSLGVRVVYAYAITTGRHRAHTKLTPYI